VRVAVSSAALALLFIVAAGFFGPRLIGPGRGPFTNAIDFRAFYCAGEAIRAGRDPYRVEPLRSCEVRESASMGLSVYRGLVVPAPLPTYALAGLSSLSRVPYKTATCAWTAALVVMIVMSSVILSRLTAHPLFAVALVTTGISIHALVLGQLAPALCFLFLLGASLLRSRNFMPAGLCIAATTIEPNLALPAALSVFVAERKARLPLVLAGTFLAVVALLFPSPRVAAEYLTQVIPAHSLSELHAPQIQYSLATALAVLGLPDMWAVRLGELQYALVLLASIALSVQLARRTGETALVVLLPTALCELGGMFMHAYAYLLAVPGALVLHHLASLKHRRIIVASLVCLGIGVTLDMLFADSFIPALSAEAVERIATLAQPNAFASSIWHPASSPLGPQMLLALLAMKVPPLIGLTLLWYASFAMAYSTAEAFETLAKPSRVAFNAASAP